MIQSRILLAATVVAASLFILRPAAQAQQQNWFVPGQQRPGGAPVAGPRAQPAPRPAPAPGGAPFGMQQQAEEQEPPPPQLQVPLPPAPDVPPLPRGSSPPAAVIGLIGVPDVMRAASAAQQIERVIGERRQKLNEDAQKEQVVWRDIQQKLASQRGGMTPDQIRTKERELQERIADTQRKFRDRNRIIQEAVQYSLAQIERTLSAVVQQVAASHGMNLVLHRAQVALNVAEFDISAEVVEHLNKALPSVVIPPDGVSPAEMQSQAGAGPRVGAAVPPATTPAATAPPANPPAAPAAPPPPHAKPKR